MFIFGIHSIRENIADIRKDGTIAIGRHFLPVRTILNLLRGGLSGRRGWAGTMHEVMLKQLPAILTA